MERITDGLHLTDPTPLGFGRPPLQARAAVVRAGGANVSVYGADGLLRELDAVRELGGLSAQYLNHSHEATAAAADVRDALGAPLHVHAADAAETARTVGVDETFEARHHVAEGLEAIPIPGHTAGATAYLFTGGQDRVLLTGDSVYLRDGRWSAAFLDAVSDRPSYVASLELLADVEFDVLLPGVAGGQAPAPVRADPADARRHLLEIAARLRAGGDR